MPETPGGVDARFLAGVFLASSIVVCGLGLMLLSDAPFTSDLGALLPLSLGALGFLVMVLIVDPVLTPKTKPGSAEVIVWLSKTYLYRLPVIALPTMAGLVTAVVEQSRSPLVLGTLGTVVLGAVWWPADQFLNAMRRRLQPIAADKVLDEALAPTGGRLVIRTR